MSCDKLATFGSDTYSITSIEDATCDVCNSKNMRQHELGQVCNDCGVVIESTILEYHRPYNEEVIQHSVLGGTTIGTIQERRRYSNSIHLNKLNKLHSIQESEKAVNSKARKEIKRIFEHLHLPSSTIDTTFRSFQDLRSQLQSGTKFRSPEKLVPITIYSTMKLHNISINEGELLEVSKITKKEFNSFKLQVSKFMPKYAERNRKQYILQKILEIREYFRLDMGFFYTAKSIMYKLWNSINCTKDDVIAGLSCSITALCCYSDRDDLTVNAICRKLGIMMSTIQSQVKNKIFDRYNIPNFESLVKSTDILRKILIALKVIEDDPKRKRNEKNNISRKDIIENDIIQIKLNKEENRAFPHKCEDEYYHFAIKDVSNNPVFIEIKTKLGRLLNRLVEHKKSYKRTREPLAMFNKYRYYRVKDSTR